VTGTENPSERLEFLAKRADADDIDALLALFQRCEVTCHCRYFQFAGDKNAWLERCFLAPEQNALELAAELRLARADSPPGVVIRAAGHPEVIGWMKLARANQLPKLYAQRPYRALPCLEGPREGVFSVGCFLIDPGYRRRGLCSRLLAEGIVLSRQSGGSALEALPRRAELLRDEELFSGPFSVFERAGFQIVNDFGPYPVLRLTL
jgi:ribosomal protein S18 acetylase RimI-like enzyme